MPNDLALHKIFKPSDPPIVQDILAVEFLSDSLLAAGCRDGSFWLHDLRSEGKVQRLRFPSAITHIKGLDEHKALVAGMENNVRYFPRDAED